MSLSLPVTVVTVAFGKPDVLRKWVQKWSGEGASCVIADNGNQIPDDIKSTAKVLPFAGNTGFGAGINRAVQESTTPVVLITNPDTLPGHTGALETLFEYHSGGCFTGAATFDSSGNEIHSTGIWPYRDWVKSQILHPAETLWRHDRLDWLQGSLIMVHKDDFLKLGGFDGNYPLYFEDVDLCFRAKEKGLKIKVCKEAEFIHDEGSGSDKATALRLACYHWGMLEYFRNHEPASARSVRKLLITKCIIRIAAYPVTGRESVKGYFSALRSLYTGKIPSLSGAAGG